MEIVIHSLGMPFDGNTIKTSSLGGSESAAVYLARELAALGHRVSVWTSKQDCAREKVDGVKYQWAGPVSNETPMGRTFEFYARNTPHDVLIVQRHPMAFHKPFASKICIWQLHDLATRRFAHHVMGGMWQIDAVTCVSEWHLKQVREVYNIDDRVLAVVPNGVDRALYSGNSSSVTYANEDELPGRYDDPNKAGDTVILMPRKKFVLLYQSRPERGLSHLVRPGGIMDRVRDLPVHLFYCSYDNTVPQMESLYQQLALDAAALPNVSCLGSLPKHQLAELQRKSDLLIYTTEFEEVSCITAMEAACAGLPMLTSNVGALAETTAGGGAHLIDLKDGLADEDAYVNWLENIIGNSAGYPRVLQKMRADQAVLAPRFDWKNAASVLMGVIEIAFERRLGDNHGRVLRHAIEHSDIHFARWYVENVLNKSESCEVDQIVHGACSELQRLYDFTKNAASYEAHYAKHQGVYYDEHEDAVVGENVTHTTRFRGVLNFVAEEEQRVRNAGRPMRLLDFGCAHGHYLIPLAQAFPEAEFLGYDVSQRAIDAANKWKEREKLTNVHFAKISEGVQLTNYMNTVDVILAGEVLEHVPDPIGLLYNFKSILNADGAIVATTPLGRWEHLGTEAFRTGREHLAHFEKEDLYDMFEGHEFKVLVAPASQDKSEQPLGSLVWLVRPKQDTENTTYPFFEPNYRRKLKYYAPRETISACLIVKDGDKTLRKCVESFVDWVDEIIIGLDPGTKDRTQDIIEQLAIDFPNRPIVWFPLDAPVLESGFDAARNATVRLADGDWILWCDADEEVHNPASLHKLARYSMHRAYGFAQVHYSLEPQEVLTTDFPMRLFRNKDGIKFYGVVHEHPEVEPGKGIPTSIARPELKFLHSGYVTEQVRRDRFQRNLPLLHRDREQYPTRRLNSFLWLRDLAQGMIFEQQQMGGGVAPHHLERAEEGVKLFESMIEGATPKMIVDALPYYSLCVMTLGKGFESNLTVEIGNPAAPDLAVKFNVQGRFHSRAFYKRLVEHILEESTKTYESTYF